MGQATPPPPPTTTTTMADDSSSKESTPPAAPASPSTTWKLPDGIEYHIEAGTYEKRGMIQ
jgi:hypothetical protein